MNKITEAFKKEKVLIPFITCGDPNLETTRELVLALEKAGAGIIELGIPFSDPTAEGPVIMEASKRALDGGTTTSKVLEMAASLKGEVQVPLVFMTYANVVYSYGIEAFMKKCAEIGVSGVILPDLPFEEKDEFAIPAKENGVSLISLIAPTSQQRTQMIAREAEGFIYLVSSLGTTGMRSSFQTNLKPIIESIREVTDVPVAIGFGISSPEQAAKMASMADGAIIGSAIVNQIFQNSPDPVDPVSQFVKDCADAVHSLQ